MSILKSAGVATIPWVCATIADLLIGGWLIDRLIERGGAESTVRKGVLLSGFVCGLAVFGAINSSSNFIAVACVCLALSGLAVAAPVFWSLPALIAPAGGAGTLAALMNFGNNLMGAAAPVVTGYVLGETHSYAAAFLTAGLILVGGLVSFSILMGQIEQVSVAESPVLSQLRLDDEAISRSKGRDV